MSNPSGSRPPRPEKALPPIPTAEEEFVLDDSEDEDGEEFEDGEGSDVVKGDHAKGECPIRRKTALESEKDELT